MPAVRAGMGAQRKWRLPDGDGHVRPGAGLAEQAGNERAVADVLHMQTLHHLGYAEFVDGVRVGLRAAEVFEQESALWDLCSASVRDLRGRSARQS